jgi:hypothetical protein
MSQGLKTKASARRWRELSICCVVVMSRISFNHGVVAMRVGKGPVPCIQGEVGVKLPSPLDAVRNSSTESSITAHHGVDTLLQVEPMNACVAPPRGEAQATEVVGDELEVPKVNDFAKGEQIASQTFIVSSDGDHR